MQVCLRSDVNDEETLSSFEHRLTFLSTPKAYLISHSRSSVKASPHGSHHIDLCTIPFNRSAVFKFSELTVISGSNVCCQASEKWLSSSIAESNPANLSS
jgi:hypothetical protein